MEHSVKAYLRRLPTKTLEEFLQDYRNRQQSEDYICVLDEVLYELARRKEEKAAE